MQQLILDNRQIRNYYSNLSLDTLYEVSNGIHNMQQPSAHDMLVLDIVTDELDRREMELS